MKKKYYLILLVAVVYFIWQIYHLIPPSGPDLKQTITEVDNLFGITWAVSKQEAERQAQQLKFTQEHLWIWDGSRSLFYKGNFGGYHSGLTLFFLPGTPSIMNKGTIITDGRDCPVDQVYTELVQQISEKYGPTPSRGFPSVVYHKQGAIGPPTEEGESYFWQVWTKNAQLVNITVSLQSKEKYGDKRWLEIEYENVSVEKEYHDELERNAARIREQYKQQ